MKKNRLPAFSRPPMRIALCLALGLITLGLRGTGLLETLERRAYDVRVRWMANRSEPSRDIVIVAIDDGSLVRMEDAVGRWPWPRSVYAPLLDYLSGAGAVGFDVLFAETDQQFSRGDEPLLEQVADHGHVVSCLYLDNRAGGVVIDTALQRHGLPALANTSQDNRSYYSALLPFPNLLLASRRLGHVNYLAEPDGVIRRYPLSLRLRDLVIPSLALATVAEFLALPAEAIRREGAYLAVGDRRVRVNPDGTYYYRPTVRAYPVYPIVDVLSAWQKESLGEVPVISRDAFKGKLVLVGSFATGLQMDRKVTPVFTDMAGVTLLATVADNLLNRQYFTRPPEGVEIILILALALLASLIKFERPLSFLLTGLLIGLFYGLVVWAGLAWGSWMLPVSGPLTGLALGVGVLGSMEWTTERLRRRQLEAMEQTKQQFTDMLVHDLKNGISSISMSLSMLDRDESGTPAARRQQMLLNTLRAGGDRLLTQVHALLDIRKIEEGHMALRCQDVNLCEYLGILVQQFKPAAEVVGLTLVTRLESSPQQAVRLDPDLFERIMGNLMWNALQYAEKGSEIVVACVVRGDRVEVSVANRGRVIPAETRAALFTPFVHGRHQEKNVRSVSTGLGLAFCRLAVEAHGGEIRLESPWPEHKDGVEVILSLPI